MRLQRSTYTVLYHVYDEHACCTTSPCCRAVVPDITTSLLERPMVRWENRKPPWKKRRVMKTRTVCMITACPEPLPTRNTDAERAVCCVEKCNGRTFAASVGEKSTISTPMWRVPPGTKWSPYRATQSLLPAQQKCLAASGLSSLHVQLEQGIFAV